MNIALMGLARSGKDSVADRLTTEHGYTRVAFADPLKEAALRVNPIIGTKTTEMWDLLNDEWEDHSYTEEVWLADVVEEHGWEYVKDNFPESRRFLQHLGASMREVDRNIWLNAALDEMEDIDGPIVVTDCRYPNEFRSLKARGFLMVRMVRPGTETDGAHDSETALQYHPADVTIANVGTLEELHVDADRLTGRV